MLFESKLFILCTLGLTGLYFVVTGIQFWITDYLIKDPDILADPMAVTIGFAITALTGPVGGVFFGGWLCDRQGGYKDNTGEATYTTLRTCMAFGFGAGWFCLLPCLISTSLGHAILNPFFPFLRDYHYFTALDSLLHNKFPTQQLPLPFPQVSSSTFQLLSSPCGSSSSLAARSFPRQRVSA